MSPTEILAALREGGTPAAWRALRDLVNHRVARAVRDPSDRDDIAQNVLLKLAQQARDGLAITATRDGEVIRYLDQMLRHCRTDLWRQTQRTPVLAQEGAEARVPAPCDVAEEHARAAFAAHAVAVFDRVADAAIAATPEAHREGRRIARRQVEALYFSDDTVDDVVARDEAIPPDTPSDVRKRAANRAMKQHQRFREAMLATSVELMARGVISGDDRAAVDRMVSELRRR